MGAIIAMKRAVRQMMATGGPAIDEEKLMLRIGGMVKGILVKQLNEEVDRRVDLRMAALEAKFLAGNHVTAVTHHLALEVAVEWKATPKNRRRLVQVLSNAMTKRCGEAGLPVLRCSRTGKRLFPVELAHKYMVEEGASLVRTLCEITH
ncbi:MAG: hypothetical protein ACJ8AH_23395 [Stellaceae bacterium]